MHRWPRIFTALVGTFVPVAGVYADMTSMSEIGPAVSAQICDRTDPKPANVSSPPLGPSAINLDSLYDLCLPQGGFDVHQADATVEPVLLLSGEATSLELCLYALIGLGLGKSALWVKKLPFAHVPDWYHCGGPYQIGASCAIGPNCLSARAVCLVQPECRPQPLLPQYRWRTITPPVSQITATPTVRAPRGPPDGAINSSFTREEAVA